MDNVTPIRDLSDQERLALASESMADSSTKMLGLKRRFFVLEGKKLRQLRAIRILLTLIFVILVLIFYQLIAIRQAMAAPVIVNGTTIQPYTDWTVTNKMPPPKITPINLIWDAPNCDADACAWEPNNITMLSGEDNAWLRDRGTFLHEVGHVIDYQIMTGNTRYAFRKIMGLPAPWRGGFNSPHEQFAEAYAQCALLGYGKVPSQWSWGYGFDPHRSYRPKVCRLVERILSSAAPSV